MSAIGIGLGALGTGLSMVGQNERNRRAQRQQKELMEIQFKNQKSLNSQGHQLQWDMWNKTNYSSQVDHMKRAGLNVGMMYGMGGGGGTTAGSQGGGSAASGQAPAQPPMDMQNLLLGKQVELAEAEIQKKKAEADDIRGVEGTKGAQEINESVARETKAYKEADESEQRRLNLETERELNEAKKDLTKHDLQWLKDNKTSSYDHQIIRAVKSVTGSWNSAIEFWIGGGKDVSPFKIGEAYERFKNGENFDDLIRQR